MTPTADNVVEIDSRRPRVRELLYCGWCGHIDTRLMIKGARFSDCPRCDETASVPYCVAFPN